MQILIFRFAIPATVVNNSRIRTKERGSIAMKKLVLALILALQFTAATQVANADPDIPVCYPCDGGK